MRQQHDFVVQILKERFEVSKQARRLSGAVHQQLAQELLAQHRGIIIAPAPIQVVGFVDDENAIVVQLVLEEPPQVCSGVEDVVVIADDDVRLHGGIKGQLERTDTMQQGCLGAHCRAEHRQFEEGVQHARAFQFAGVIVCKLAHAFVAEEYLVETALGFGPKVNGREPCPVPGESPQSFGGEGLLGGLGGDEKYAQAVAQRMLQGREECRHRLADARGR